MYLKAFLNGNVYTANPNAPRREAILTGGNKILAVGSSDEIRRMYTKDVEEIDLKGRLVLPGFTDSHTHLLWGGKYLNALDLRSAHSREDVIRLTKEYLSAKSVQWILGGNWNNGAWNDSSLPCREWFDDFTPETPLFLTRTDLHLGIANTAALQRAGITRETPDPAGGQIDKDPASGEVTGILRDSAMVLITSILPKPPRQETESFLDAALETARSFGITSVHDISEPEDFLLFQEYEKAGKLTLRIYSRFPIRSHPALSAASVQYGFGSEKVRYGSLKAFADGSLGSSTALFIEPYTDDPGNYGLATDLVLQKQLNKLAREADRNKLQLCIHAIGDKANAIVLDCVQEISQVNPRWDRRFRIEHAQHLRPKEIERIAEYNVIVSAQPVHLHDDAVWMEEKIGYHRVREAFSFRSILNAGGKLCFGSDWPVASLNPLLGIHAAVNRTAASGKYAAGCVLEERISVGEAVRAYTIDAAYAAYHEKCTGSIEQGKFADFVVLSDDIFSIHPSKIKDASVVMTVFDGEIVKKN